jgi:hypothetical protein
MTLFTQLDEPLDLGIRAGDNVLAFPEEFTVHMQSTEDAAYEPQLADTSELIVDSGAEPQLSYFTKKANPLPRPHYTQLVGSPVDFADWTSDRSTDTPYGFGAEPLEDETNLKPSKAFRVQEHDLIIFSFLSRYRYATTDQLARLLDKMPRTVAGRMKRLEAQGFVHSKNVTDGKMIWLNRKAGGAIVESPFSPIHRSEVSFFNMAHSLGLVNIAVELEREQGGTDVLGERQNGSPAFLVNRFKLGNRDSSLPKTLGEMTVSERQMRQAQMTGRVGGRPKSFPQLSHEVKEAVANSAEAPELQEGNEHLFIVYGARGKSATGGVEHVPDLVVTRDRDANGKPMNIAIELELTKKNPEEWKEILRYYRDFGWMYDKVIYMTHKRSIAEGLKRVNETVRLGESGTSPKLVIRKYVPTSGNSTPFWG